jgi:hypothetical protein
MEFNARMLVAGCHKKDQSAELFHKKFVPQLDRAFFMLIDKQLE